MEHRKISFFRSFSISFSLSLSFSYDFRKGLDEQEEFFANLTQLVQETYESNNQTKIVFVTHSMGGEFISN